MFNRTQTTPTTSDGTSSSSQKKLLDNNRPTAASRDDINKFFEDFSMAKQSQVPGAIAGIPEVEAPREVVEHLAAGRVKELEKTPYIVYDGCIVFIEGKHQEILDEMKKNDKLYR